MNRIIHSDQGRLMLFMLIASISRLNANTVSSYQFDIWQADQGLPQSTVTSIVQTHDGYLWMGTQDGLVRFDGINFKVFNRDNTPAIKNDRLVQLFEDRLGTLWISGEEGELLCLRNGRFTYYKMPGRGSPFNYARQMCDDVDGNLWIVSCEWQLNRLGTNNCFTVLSTNWNISGVHPNGVVSDQTGRTWVQTEEELAVWQNQRFKSVCSQTNEGNFHVRVAKSRTTGIWVAAERQLRKFQDGHWSIDLGAYAWTNSPIYDLYEDSGNHLWVATMGSGLFRYSSIGKVLHLTTKDGLPSDFVRCVMEDREGNVWVGTESGGLCRLKPAIFQSLGVRQGLASDHVTSVSQSTNGDFWIAMDGEGLDHLLSDGKVEHYGRSQGLMNGHVWSVLQDHHGIVWAGTWDGLFCSGNGSFADLSDGQSIGRQTFAIYEDSQGDILLGQQGFGAIARLQRNERMQINIPGTLSSLDVRVMVRDPAGSLWVGTENDGLYRLQNTRWTHFGKEEGLASETVWSLSADDDGALWIGTCGGGLSRCENGKMTTWTTRNGLINNVICQILDDEKGNLWLGSYGGVYCISKQQLIHGAGTNLVQCIGYGRGDGLPSIECVGGCQPSGLRSRDGRMWFPTVKGFAIVNPDEIPHNPFPPPVVIEDVVMDGVTVLPAGNGGVSVPPGKQRLEFQYTALSLTDPEKVRFRYRLEGIEDNAWNEAGPKRAADYSYIPPGRYRFHVIACNNDGVWNETGDFLAVTVLPYFWQTKWFIFLTILAALGSVAVSVRYLVKRKLQRKIAYIERERAIEAERTRIANDIHDDLGAGLTEIVILSELAQIADGSRDTVQTDVRNVTEKARALTHSLDEIVWAVNPENDTLDNFVSYTCNFAQNYLQLAKIRCRLEVPARIPDVPLTAETRHSLFMVVKEALNNIVKHAKASEAWIHVAVDSAKFTVTLKDNGRGFALEFDEGPAQGAMRTVRRNGLANMRKRMLAIGGQFKLESSLGHGTEIELTVYVNKNFPFDQKREFTITPDAIT